MLYYIYKHQLQYTNTILVQQKNSRVNLFLEENQQIGKKYPFFYLYFSSFIHQNCLVYFKEDYVM